ncbi:MULTISPECIES: MarR family winged helix-turn-helix transcriptional regulator [Streptomyces]|uniref:MarR family winged helix-turn-helix transcriptional regulator n=1 Tax=Streptomyces TaxID=1883 RepID=UPI0005673110|nr:MULTISPECIES: MarR family transcriptional regulator [Streptomyces]MBZ6113644.1 MarR family transcriptional regulator [Streptomyces olivaceus]MBZ6127441.1 MarR family transcriptional regulator [Streptomyces olivaceus]MBZ6148272.1 MarR family transcriptional regulator [Streptomyces olivaceus]MBZ6162189.1 MarR family transcriptional regulator [Streptomyces olivaceus]MBZ6189992.1 MarR family transcriptional regulator [Streptomyces olivaceus]
MHNALMDRAREQETPPTSPDDLIVAVERMVRYVRQSARTGSLSTAASSTLGRLEREGPQRLTELARAEGVSQPNMTQLVTRLERAGLVRRTADASDGRGVLVAVTSTGLEVVARRRAERAHALEQLMEDMTGPERQATTTALLALARVVENRQETSEEHRA